MLAVEPSHQGGALLGEVVTELVSRGLSAGYDSLFIYTKPEYISTFEALNFSLLANQGRVALLEYGRGFQKWLATHNADVRSGINGAVVVNCNPFTLGHRYLIESAAKQVDNLYVFVVREDRSVFPFDVRFQLVKDGVRDLTNVVVLDSSRYIVSGATFPTYFLKKDDPVARIQMELDVTLFASRIAPFFRLVRRFVGTEPTCKLTEGYNDAMRRILPVYDIELVVIERKQSAGGVISASRVRVPGVSSRLVTPGEGGLPALRIALAVEAMPSLRPVARSSVQPCKMPSATIRRGAVASPSASNSREAP